MEQKQCSKCKNIYLKHNAFFYNCRKSSKLICLEYICKWCSKDIRNTKQRNKLVKRSRDRKEWERIRSKKAVMILSDRYISKLLREKSGFKYTYKDIKDRPDLMEEQKRIIQLTRLNNTLKQCLYENCK